MREQSNTKANVWWLVGGLVVLLLGLVVFLRDRGTPSSQPSASQKTGAWFSVRLFPDQQGWAVTVHGILHTTDDGQHWTDVTPWTSADDVFGGRTDEVTSFTNGNQAWLILPGRTLYRKMGQQQPELARSFHSIDGGKTWQRSTLPDTGSTYSDTQSGAGFISGFFGPLNMQGEDRGQVGIGSLSTFGDNDAWVAVVKTATHTGGGEESIIPLYSRIWRSSNSGQSWHLVMDEKPTNNNSGPLDEGWITFLNTTTGVMRGPTSSTIRVSHNGGANWQVQHLPMPHLTPTLLQRVTQEQASFFDAQNGVFSLQVLLDDHNVGDVVYTTHDGAKTWKMSSMQTLNSSANAFCLDTQNWIFMPNNITLRKTTDGGHTWNTLPTNIGTPYFNDLNFTSQQEGWAIGRNVQYLQGSQYSRDDATTLLKTMDGGHTWVKANYIVQA